MDTVSETKETTETNSVNADHFEVVSAAIAAKKAANDANSENYNASVAKLDELDKEIRDERQVAQDRADALYLTREAVRNAYHAEAKRIERDYRVAVYGEDHVAREEKAEADRLRRGEGRG